MARLGRSRPITPRLIVPNKARPNGFWFRERFEGGAPYANETMIWGGTASHPYTTTGGTGSTFDLNHTADFALGDRSIKITTNGTNANTFVRKLNGTAMDFTNRVPRIWIKVDTNANFLDGQLWLGSGGALANAYKFKFSPDDAVVPQYFGGEWQSITFPWSYATTTGTPTRSALTDLNFQIFDGSAGVLNVWWGGISSIPDTTVPYPNGVVSFTFDDGFASTTNEAASYMDPKHMRGTCFIIDDVLGTGVYMTTSQVQALESTYGWEIGLHSHTAADHNAGGGLTSLTEAQLRANMAANRANLLSLGIKDPVSMAWPQGLTNVATGNVMKDIVSGVARTTKGAHTNTFPPYDRVRAYSRAVDASDSSSTINTIIDNAVTNKDWLILLFHDIVSSGATGNQCNRSTFRAIVDHAETAGIAVLPVKEVYDGRPPGRDTITISNTDFNTVTQSDTAHGSLTMDPENRVHGRFGANVKADATGSQITMERTFPTGSIYVRFYLTIGDDTTTATIVRCRASPTTNVCGLRRRSDGVGNTSIELRNGTTNTGTKTTALGVDTPARIEWFVDAVNNTQTLRLYKGANVEGTTFDEEITDATATNDPNILQFGTPNTVETTADDSWDDIALDTAGWIGPLAYELTPPVEGVAPLTATSNLVTAASVTEVATATLAATSNLVTAGTVTTPYPAVLGANGQFDEAETQAFMGVLQDSNGNLYRVLESTLADNNQPRMMKSTDEGLTWTEQDAANRPGTSAGVICDLESGHVTWDHVDKTITFTWQRSGNVAYSKFKTSDAASNPDTWTSNVRELHTTVTAAAPQYTSHTSPQDQAYEWLFWGSNTPKPQFRSRTNSSTLGSVTDVDSTGVNPSAVLLPNEHDTMIIYEKSNQVHYKKLTSSGTLDSSSTRVDASGLQTGSSGAVVAYAAPVAYLGPNGTDVVVSVLFIDVNGDLRSVDIVNGTPGSESVVTTNNPAADVGTTTSLQGVIALAVHGTTLHAVWADGTSYDVLHASKPYGQSWSGTDTLYNTAGGEDVDWVSAAVVTHSGQTYLGYTYYVGPFTEDAGTTYYNRLSLVSNIAGSATLAATSNLTTTALVTEVAAATLAATSNLVPTALVTELAAATLASTSNLVSVPSITTVAVASLPATSNLVTVPSVTVFVIANLDSTADLVTTALVTEIASATLAATSNLSTTAVLTVPATATLAATSNLVTTALVTEVATATLAATSDLVTSAAGAVSGTADLAATSDLTTTGTVSREGAATLAATSDLTTAAVLTVPATATLAATSDLVTASIVTAVASVTIPATSNLSVTAVPTVLASATLAATSDLVTAATLTRLGTATLAAVSDLFAEVQGEVGGTATLAATSDLSVVAEPLDIQATVDLDSASDLSTGGEVIKLADLFISALSDLTITSEVEVFADMDLAASSDLVTEAEVGGLADATAALTATSNLVIGGVVTKLGVVFMQGQHHLSAVPQVATVQAVAFIPAVSDMTTVAFRGQFATAAMQQTSDLTTHAFEPKFGIASMVAISYLLIGEPTLAVVRMHQYSWLHATAEEPFGNVHPSAVLTARRWRAGLAVSHGRTRWRATLD